MNTDLDHPDIAQFNARAQEALGAIMEQWSPCGSGFVIPAQTDLFALPEAAERNPGDVYRVREGRLSYVREEKPVFHYEEGSLVGLLGERERGEIQVLRTFDDERTAVAPYSLVDLQAVLAADPGLAALWQQYNQALLRVMVAVAEHHMSFLPRVAPHILRFEPGEVLMSEGEAPSRAFYLLEGKAKVLAGGRTTVGEVESGQLLGHLGLFKGGPRTATVVAETACDAIALSEQELLGLLQVRPDLCKNVLAQLAGTVGQLNRTVSNLA